MPFNFICPLNMPSIPYFRGWFHLRSAADETTDTQREAVICDKCSSGPLTPSSFRSVMDGKEIVHTTTRSEIKFSMDNGCGLCRLLWLASQTRSVADGDEARPEEVQFRLTIRSVSPTAGFRQISPEGVQYLCVDPIGGYGKNYYLYTRFNDPAAAEIVGRTPILDVNSPEAYKLALESLDTCVLNHPHCPKPEAHTPLPTRVLDYKDPSRPRLFLSMGASFPYVALSYVWGGPQASCTKRNNASTYMSRGISRRFLPQTIRDAIEVTGKLGIRYLWVDAFCIVQDSDEDKTRELIKMRDIYHNAYVTIIASSATSANAGFLQTRTLSQEYTEHPQLPFQCRDGLVGRIFAFSQDGPTSVYQPMKEPVNSRAWCLQERLLSPRKLVYAINTIQYHCQTALADIGGAVSGKPVGEQLDDVMFKFAATNNGPNDIDTTLSSWTPVDWESLQEAWRMIVSNYTRRAVSNQEDKLFAFAGVAEEFHRIWDVHSGRYIAGVWEKFLPNDLLWSRVSSPYEMPPENGDPLRSRLSRSFAPSWSWMSVDGHILPDDSNWGDSDNTDCEILQCDMTLKDEQLPYGHITAASLILRVATVPTPWIVFPKVGGDPCIFLSLYMPTDLLRNRVLEEPEKHEGVAVGQISDESRMGEKITLNADRLPSNGLVAIECGMEEDKLLLKFMGDITPMFDSHEQVPIDQVAAIVVQRFQVDNDPGAKGLLVVGAGGGTFRRIGYWISFVRLRGSVCDDASGRKMAPWFDSEDFGSTSRNVVLV